MTIKGLIFDFDGLILDTETPEYQVLQDMFRSYGADLPLTEWSAALGASLASFDPMLYLQKKVGRTLDQDRLFQSWKQQSLALIRQQPPLPGVVPLIHQAKQRGLKLGVASSSPYEWVQSHLSRLELAEAFDIILTANDVTHIKPHPELYQSAVEALNIKSSEAIALEDSPNGITAAREAGLFCIAVLNPLTRHLNTSHANVVFDSLEGVTLELLLEKAEA
jgi:HAD superfamily hydrolase (TIGR01509 family)